MEELIINAAGGSYPVIIGNGAIKRVKDFIKGKCLIVADSNVAPLYAEKVKAQLQGVDCFFAVFPAGESSKCKEQLFRLIDKMAEYNINRQDTVIALGGGVTGDLTGLAAGLYMRGVSLIMMPTTLLAMVDSSVGGKVAINHEAGKNMVGMFYQPSAVIADLDTLATLDKEQISCGAAEMIKYGCIYDKKLFELLQNKENLLLESTVKKCVAAKAYYVERDTLDKGDRMLLNFGHTIGHCIEKETGIPHGQAVAIGMYKEAQLGESLGLTMAGTAERIKAVTAVYDLPCKAESYGIEKYLVHDKKSDNKGITMALVEEIGKGVLQSISVDKIKEALL